VGDFIELGELMCRDALTREESCGGHFREEHQFPDGECKRDDTNFGHVAAWEFQGEGKVPLRNVEPLNYEAVKMSVRSYK
jgi:succinate dehydrogenase / fumarate reductase flavoprotein subunit